MQIELSTPALLFPAVSLLLLAYTNRFVTLATLIRSLAEKYKTDHSVILLGQIRNLRLRVNLIKHMQAAGVTSLFFCVLCMFSLFFGFELLGRAIFGFSLLLMLASLGISVTEIWISVNALNLQLSNLEVKEKEFSSTAATALQSTSL